MGNRLYIMAIRLHMMLLHAFTQLLTSLIFTSHQTSQMPKTISKACANKLRKIMKTKTKCLGLMLHKWGISLTRNTMMVTETGTKNINPTTHTPQSYQNFGTTLTKDRTFAVFVRVVHKV